MLQTIVTRGFFQCLGPEDDFSESESIRMIKEFRVYPPSTIKHVFVECRARVDNEKEKRYECRCADKRPCRFQDDYPRRG